MVSAKMTDDELQEILHLHTLWLEDKPGGVRANLTGANLTGVTFIAANLADTDLKGAKLKGATLPDGRAYEQWRADPLDGLCNNATARARAIGAWGNHTWNNCPMHEANGWAGHLDAPEDKRILLATFVALFDGHHLPQPKQRG